MRASIRRKVEILPIKRSVVSPKRLLRLIDKEPEKIDKIRFITPKLGTKSLGKFIVDHEW